MFTPDLHTFRDREEAGRILAARLGAWATRDDPIVLALPRGGVPVAAEVAKALKLPLDVIVVRKLGVPGEPEFAMGAIASGGVRVLNEDVVRMLGIDAGTIEDAARAEGVELERRERLYRGDRPRPALAGRTVIVVDDGLATGATMRAAVTALRRQAPARIVVAVPVGAPDTCAQLRGLADEVIAVHMPEHFVAVGRWYSNFGQTEDEEVQRLLAKYAPPQRQEPP